MGNNYGTLSADYDAGYDDGHAEGLAALREKIEAMIEASRREQRVILVSLTEDPDRPNCGLGWEAAYALEDDELDRRFEADDDRSWEMAKVEHHEAYDEETGKQAGLEEMLTLLSASDTEDPA